MSFEKVSHQELARITAEIKALIGALDSLPTTDKSSLVAALTEVFTSAGNGKAAIAAAITGKGVETASDAANQTMAEHIGQIETGITPEGTKNITANGSYDVTQFAQAEVNVSADAPTLIAKNVTANGSYDASSDNADGYSSVTVNVPVGSTNSKCYKKVFDSKITSTGWIYFNDADADIAAHRDDSTFVLTIMNVTDFSALAGRTVGVTALNHKMNSYYSQTNYGMLLYVNSASGAAGTSFVNKAVNVTSPAAGGSQICVTADGKIGIYASSTTTWEAGTYVAVCGW